MKRQTARSLITVFTLIALLSATAFVISADAPSAKTKPIDLNSFMAQKRAYSQIVLDGLMSEDYQTIILAGENMRKMRSDKRWQQRPTSADYNRYSEDFEKSAQAMIDAARRENLDRCMTSYVKCLQACYNCHKYVRAFPLSTSFERSP
jgi:hypothetical protein